MPVNPKSLENLRSWQPGQSGNPGGRPSKRPITDPYFQRAGHLFPEVIRLQFNEKMETEVLKLGATWADANALRRFLDALMEGGATSSKEIREAIEGKAPQRMEISGPERKEVTLRVVYDAPRKLRGKPAGE
jgi:Family of unknown function (DUF5681)